MSDEKQAGPPAPLPSATIMLLRDGAAGLEVFMVKRHYQIDFASGALVFPGGKVDPADGDPALAARCGGMPTAGTDGLNYRVAGIREAFEECGVLLAREGDGGAVLPGARQGDIRRRYRAAVAAGEITMLEVVERENLILATDGLVTFAHWVTPELLPRRFETFFYLAPMPSDHAARHDGSESVDSCWIRPADAVADAAAGEVVIVFPTRLNLEKLARADTVSEALELARSEPVVTIMPTPVETGDGVMLRIPADAGYATTEGPVDPVLKRMKPRQSP